MTGERGDTGQRGVAGERGPKGDHGQQGDAGPQGSGAPRRALIGYLILCVFLGVALWGGYHADQKAERSIQVNCRFGNENRNVIRLILQDSNRRLQTSEQRSQEEKRVGEQVYMKYLSILEPFDCDALK